MSRGRPRVGIRVYIRIPEKLLDRIDRIAKREGEPRAVIIRRLLKKALENC